MRKYLIVTCCLLGVSVPAVAAGPPSVAPREGVVLLSNGEILRGTIIPAGDRYDVHLESGEISLRKVEIAIVCQSVEECYSHKRAGIDPGRVQDHLELAEWCVRNRLFAEAQRELADARKADAMHPKIRLIASRLELASNPAPAEGASGAVRPVSNAPLDVATRNLPPGTMETFTNTIQPLLLNNCSKSGCHAGRSEGGFKLERMHPRFASRTTTQRNLEQVLMLVQQDDPSMSPLLQTPIRPHGSVKMPIFTDRHQGQYRQLVQWVYAVAGSYTPSRPPSLTERTAPLLQNMAGLSGNRSNVAELESELPDIATNPSPVGAATEDLPDTDAAEVAPGPSPAAGEIDSTASQKAYTPEQLRAMGLDPNGQRLGQPGGQTRQSLSLDDGPQVQRGAKPPEGFTPRDEFDPEIFNRRYFER